MDYTTNMRMLSTKFLVEPTGMPTTASKHGDKTCTTLVNGDWEPWWKDVMAECAKLKVTPAAPGNPDILFYFPDLTRLREEHRKKK
jgi:hypothetical protein